MELREYRGEESMHRGAFGIMEPMGKRFTALSEISLAVIPGVAFDAKGNRLGRGRGYYDRLLPALKKSGVTTSGICFDFQILSSLPCEDHDIPVDFLI